MRQRVSWSTLRRALEQMFVVEPHALHGLPEALPISLPGNTPGVLCIHGFTGVPAEVRLACEVAQSLGMATEAPCLSGHGVSSADLSKTRFEDWVDSVRPAFQRLRAQGPTIVVGLSLGSLIATRLALEAPDDVLGVAMLANAFWLRAPYPARALDLADRLRLPDFGVRKRGSDLGDESARSSHVSYQVQPVRAAISLLRAGEKMRRELPRLRAPTLILHGARDRVCPVENAWKVAERMTTSDVRVVVLPRSHHILTRDRDRAQVCAELEVFFRRFLSASSPRRSGA